MTEGQLWMVGFGLFVTVVVTAGLILHRRKRDAEERSKHLIVDMAKPETLDEIETGESHRRVQ